MPASLNGQPPPSRSNPRAQAPKPKQLTKKDVTKVTGYTFQLDVGRKTGTLSFWIVKPDGEPKFVPESNICTRTLNSHPEFQRIYEQFCGNSVREVPDKEKKKVFFKWALEKEKERCDESPPESGDDLQSLPAGVPNRGSGFICINV